MLMIGISIEDEVPSGSPKTDGMIWKPWWMALLIGSNATFIDWSDFFLCYTLYCLYYLQGLWFSA